MSGPTGSAIEHAFVDVWYTPAPARAGEPSRGATVSDWLTLEGQGRSYRFLVDQWDQRDFPGCADPMCAPIAERARVDFVISIAPDQHALALSTDHGGSYRYVALDTGDAPLYCGHRSVVLSVDSPESWTRVVPTRALAVEILGSGHGPGENTVHLGHGFAREYAAAMRYGCRHGEDLELQAAVLRAFLEHEDWQGDPHSEAFGASLDCVRGIARSSVPPRLRFIAMLQNRREAPRAAQLLADTPEPDAQEAIAQVLAPLLDTASSASEGGPDVDALRSQLAWTLARITTLRRDASPLVVETLVHAATQSELPATRPSIVYAIRALTMLQAIEAGNALRRAAAGTCAEPIAQWPTTFVDWPGADAETATHPIACWAQAALTERTRLYGEDRLQVTH